MVQILSITASENYSMLLDLIACKVGHILETTFLLIILRKTIFERRKTKKKMTYLIKISKQCAIRQE